MSPLMRERIGKVFLLQSYDYAVHSRDGLSYVLLVVLCSLSSLDNVLLTSLWFIRSTWLDQFNNQCWKSVRCSSCSHCYKLSISPWRNAELKLRIAINLFTLTYIFMTFGMGNIQKLLEASERSTKGVKYPKTDQNYILSHFVSNLPVICTFNSKCTRDETLPTMN